MIQRLESTQKASDDILFCDNAYEFFTVAVKNRETAKTITAEFIDGVNQGFIRKQGNHLCRHDILHPCFHGSGSETIDQILDADDAHQSPRLNNGNSCEPVVL